MASRPTTRRTRRDACPLCGEPSAREHKPFCGQGCRDRDLINWLDGAYRAPGPPASPDGLDSEG